MLAFGGTRTTMLKPGIIEPKQSIIAGVSETFSDSGLDNHLCNVADLYLMGLHESEVNLYFAECPKAKYGM
jgi:hypothetical protein